MVGGNDRQRDRTTADSIGCGRIKFDAASTPKKLLFIRAWPAVQTLSAVEKALSALHTLRKIPARGKRAFPERSCRLCRHAPRSRYRLCVVCVARASAYPSKLVDTEIRRSHMDDTTLLQTPKCPNLSTIMRHLYTTA